MKQKYTVYVVVGPGGRRYVGVTSSTLSVRKKQHLRFVKRGSKYRFHRAMRARPSRFRWRVVKRCSTWKEAGSLEKTLIDKWKTKSRLMGYNTFRGGPRPRRRSLETRRRISAVVTKRMADPKIKAHLSKVRTGKGNHRYGKKRSMADRRRLALVRGGAPFAGYSATTGKQIGVWVCRGEAAEALGLYREGILACLKGRYKTTQGYVFRYLQIRSN